MDRYAQLPTADQLEVLSRELEETVRFDHRIEGGLGGTVDVLQIGDGVERVVLRRYWVPEKDEPNPAEGEFRALALAAEHGIPAPAPLWIDRIGLFPERATVISFLEGRPLLNPADPCSWATQLAEMLALIHRINLAPSDRRLFPQEGHDDGHHSTEETMEALMQHPLGARLWAKCNDALRSFELDDRVYVHHDFWPGNTLWIGQKLVAVVDWEGGCVGDPALDVAYCALDIRLLGLDRAADHFVAVYRERSGRDLGNLSYWELAALCRPMADIDLWVESWQAMGSRRRSKRLVAATHPSSQAPSTPVETRERRGPSPASPLQCTAAQAAKASSKAARNSGVLGPLNPQ